MKKIYFFLSCFLLTTTLQAQIQVGVKLNPGLGFITSSTLNGLLASEKSKNPNLLTSGASAGVGFNYGIGGFCQYNFSPSLSVVIEPTINLLFSHIYLTYKNESFDSKGNGTQTRIFSNARLNTLYCNVPLIVKYSLKGRLKPYVLGGLSVNLSGSPHLKSKEVSVVSKYNIETISTSSQSEVSASAVMNNYSAAQFNFVIGVGRTFRKKLKNLSVDIRYNFPLTGGAMYSSDNSAFAQSYNNGVFSSEDKFHLPNSSNLYDKPNNFKMSVVNVSIKYTLYKLTIKTKVKPEKHKNDFLENPSKLEP